MASWKGWEDQLLEALGVPKTPNNRRFLEAWHAAEGSNALNNPLNTTWDLPGAVPLAGNSASVKNYVTPQMGLEATVKTLTNGRYNPILAAMRNGQATPTQLASLVIQSPWGTKHFPTLNASELPNPQPGPPLNTQEIPNAPANAPNHNSYIDLVNQLEQIHSGLSQGIDPSLTPLRSARDENVVARISDTFGEFGRAAASDTSRPTLRPLRTLGEQIQDITSLIPTPASETRVQPRTTPSTSVTPIPGLEGVPVAKGDWKYPEMTTGGKNNFANLSFAGHTDFSHVDTRILNKLNRLGVMLGVKVDVISGYRSPKYSASVGGYANDPHARGVAVDAYINGVPIGDYRGAYQLLKKLGLESGAQPNFYRGKRDPEHVQIPGSGINKSIHARRTLR